MCYILHPSSPYMVVALLLFIRLRTFFSKYRKYLVLAGNVASLSLFVCWPESKNNVIFLSWATNLPTSQIEMKKRRHIWIVAWVATMAPFIQWKSDKRYLGTGIVSTKLLDHWKGKKAWKKQTNAYISLKDW